MRVAGNKKGKVGKGHGISDKGGVQQRGQWQQQRGQWQQGWQVSNSNKGVGNGDSNGGYVGNGDIDEAGGQ